MALDSWSQEILLNLLSTLDYSHVPLHPAENTYVGTVIPQYMQGIGSRTPTYAKAHAHSSPAVGPSEPTYTKSQPSIYADSKYWEYYVFSFCLVEKSAYKWTCTKTILLKSQLYFVFQVHLTMPWYSVANEKVMYSGRQLDLMSAGHSISQTLSESNRILEAFHHELQLYGIQEHNIPAE